jgi:DNA-directed RNA polymerase specialized sigma24 family protein
MGFSCEVELASLYEREFGRLCGHLDRKFRILDYSACEDAAAESHQEALAKCRAGFEPEKDWRRYWYWLANKRALDQIRRIEREKTVSIAILLGGSGAAVWEPADHNAPPDLAAMANEQFAKAAKSRRRRDDRKKKILSEILSEYIHECELKERFSQKEAYERALRGQKPNVIAEAMGIERNYVDQLIFRSRRWLLDRVRQRDVHQSVFRTIHCIEAEAAETGRKPRVSEVKLLGDLVRWVMDHTDAMCPSLDRLRAFARDRGSTALPDVRFHVEDVPCHLCSAELAEIQHDPTSAH